MSILGKLTSAVVKTALTPVAIAKDVGNAVTGNKINATEKHINSTLNDLESFADGMCGEDV